VLVDDNLYSLYHLFKSGLLIGIYKYKVIVTPLK